jgi:hypothetical protein
MSDLATMQAQLAALKNALWSGSATVSYEGKSVSYRSSEDMRIAIANLETAISGAPPIRSFVVRGHKGW